MPQVYTLPVNTILILLSSPKALCVNLRWYYAALTLC